MSETDFSRYRQSISPYRKAYGYVFYGTVFANGALIMLSELDVVDGGSSWLTAIRLLIIASSVASAVLWLFNVGARQGKPETHEGG